MTEIVLFALLAVVDGAALCTVASAVAWFVLNRKGPPDSGCW